MCPPRVVFWCYTLLFIASFSDSLGKSTNNDEQRNNMTVRDFFVNSTKDRDDETELHNSRENSTKNNDEMQSHVNSDDRKNSTHHIRHIMKIRKENNPEMFTESHVNSTEINDVNDSTLRALNEILTKPDRENNSMSYELYRNYNIDDYNGTVPYEACSHETCIQLCFRRSFNIRKEVRRRAK